MKQIRVTQADWDLFDAYINQLVKDVLEFQLTDEDFKSDETKNLANSRWARG